MSLILGFKKIESNGYLKDVQTILAEADADLNWRPAPTNKGLRRFTESDEFSMDDAARVVEELQSQWLKIQGATADKILRLRNALLPAGLALGYYRMPRGCSGWERQVSAHAKTVTETGTRLSI